MNALIYAQSGGGKTVNSTLITTKERGKNLLLCSDNSSIVLNNFKRPNLDIEQIVKWETFIKQFERAVESKKYDCIIIDNLTDLFDMAILEYDASGRYKDMRQAYQIVYQTLKRLSRMSAQVDCDVIFTAWEMIDEITLPSGERTNRVRPHLPLKVLDNILGLMNVVGHVESAIGKDQQKHWYYRTEGSITLYAKDQLYIRKVVMPEYLFTKKED